MNVQKRSDTRRSEPHEVKRAVGVEDKIIRTGSEHRRPDESGTGHYWWWQMTASFQNESTVLGQIRCIKDRFGKRRWRWFGCLIDALIRGGRAWSGSQSTTAGLAGQRDRTTERKFALSKDGKIRTNGGNKRLSPIECLFECTRAHDLRPEQDTSSFGKCCSAVV